MDVQPDKEPDRMRIIKLRSSDSQTRPLIFCDDFMHVFHFNFVGSRACDMAYNM